MGDDVAAPSPPAAPAPKKGFWAKVADVIGEMLGTMIDNRQ